MTPGKPWTAANWLMAALFGLSAIVQLNDPDALRWILVYAAAATIAVLEARRAMRWPAAVIVMLAAVGSAVWIGSDLQPAPLGSLFEEWEMRDTAVEETREIGGLLIVAFWMAAVGVAAGMRARKT